MSNISELKDVLKETLEERGVLAEIRAKIRSEIFNTLNDKPKSKPELSNENLIINELIREYLIFNNYTHSLSVFIPESGQPEKAPFDRNYLSKKLKILEDRQSKELPLLYGLAFGLKKMLIKEEVPENNYLAAEIEERNHHTATHTKRGGFPEKENVVEKEEGGAYRNIFEIDDPKPIKFKKPGKE